METRLNLPPRVEILKRKLAASLNALGDREDLEELASYGPTPGGQRDRAAAAEWLQPVLGSVSADDVLVGAGGVSLLVALLTTLAKPGDTIVTESLTYPGIRAISRHFGMNLIGVSIDEEGIVPAALAEACRTCRPKILYCTPTIHNPTTATMSVQRRAEIVGVAREFDLTIFEDDAYAFLPDKPMPPLAVLAPERTCYMASLSKCLAPGLRIAYCVGPGELRPEIQEGIRVVTFLASRLLVAIVTDWIEEGSAWAIRDEIRAEANLRQDIAREILGERAFKAKPGGPHIWLPLPKGYDIVALGESLRARGLGAKGDGFAVDGNHPDALRVVLGASPDRDALAAGLLALKSLLW